MILVEPSIADLLSEHWEPILVTEAASLRYCDNECRKNDREPVLARLLIAEVDHHGRGAEPVGLVADAKTGKRF